MYIGTNQDSSNSKKQPKYPKIQCPHCHEFKGSTVIKRHISMCYLNPVNLKLCPVCDDPIKDFKKNTVCSRSCSNTYFRVGPGNGNWKPDSYRSTCFHYHEKKCVVCGEENIVAVHHLDENHDNNDPANLIPLCPTHHQYCHSRFKYLIEDTINEYLTARKKKW